MTTNIFYSLDEESGSRLEVAGSALGYPDNPNNCLNFGVQDLQGNPAEYLDHPLSYPEVIKLRNALNTWLGWEERIYHEQ